MVLVVLPVIEEDQTGAEHQLDLPRVPQTSQPSERLAASTTERPGTLLLLGIRIHQR